MEETGMTGKQMEQMFKMLSQLNKEQSETFMAAIKELRKPTEAEQEKMDKEKALAKQKLENRILAAKADEQGKAMRKAGCSHSMPDGKHTWRTQVNQDGYFRPLCVVCNTVLPPIKATLEQIKEGVNLESYKSIDMAMLEKWAEHTRKSA